MAAENIKRYFIYFEYSKDMGPIKDYATSYASEAEAEGYIQSLAKRALKRGIEVSLTLTDMQTGMTLLWMAVDREVAYAQKPNPKSVSGVTGFVVAKPE